MAANARDEDAQQGPGCRFCCEPVTVHVRLCMHAIGKGTSSPVHHRVSLRGLQALHLLMPLCACSQELSLAGNFLRELPEGLGGLGNLRKLQLSGNRLEELPGSLCELSRLEVRHSCCLDASWFWGTATQPEGHPTLFCNVRCMQSASTRAGAVGPWEPAEGAPR